MGQFGCAETHHGHKTVLLNTQNQGKYKADIDIKGRVRITGMVEIC